MSNRFTDKVVVVTGAGRGIGAATAEMFAREGAKVALLARSSRELDEVAARIGSGRALALPCDVAVEADVEAAFTSLAQRWGRPHHLVNNAGVVGQGPIVSTTVATWDEVMAVNLRGAFLCSRAFLHGRDKSLGGTIVNVTSISGAVGSQKFPGFGAYATSKAGLMALTEVLAVEAADLGVRVNAVSPGSTDTQMFRSVAPGVQAHLQPDDIARVILFACSDESSAIRGKSFDAWG